MVLREEEKTRARTRARVGGLKRIIKRKLRRATLEVRDLVISIL